MWLYPAPPDPSTPPLSQMCDPHGNPNLLTAPADEKWKAIRKGIAVSFAFQNIKKKYPMVLSRVNEVRYQGRQPGRPLQVLQGTSQAVCWAIAADGLDSNAPCPRSVALQRPPPFALPQLAARVAALGPKASIDVDQAALRVTLDVIGLAGFGHDYQSVKQDKPEYDHLLVRMRACVAHGALMHGMHGFALTRACAAWAPLPQHASSLSWLGALLLPPAPAIAARAAAVLHRGHDAHRQPAARGGPRHVQNGPQG